MKKLLLTITSALLFNFINTSYATDLKPIELNDLPDDLKRKISTYLMPNDIAQLTQVNKSFHANITVAVNKMVSETAQQLRFNFEEITPFCKDFLMNVRTGNFIMTVLNCYSVEDPEIMMIDNNGNTKIDDSVDYDHSAWREEKVYINAENRDRSILVGAFQPIDDVRTNKKGIVYRKDKYPIYLSNLNDDQSNDALTVSDKGEIVAGWSSYNKELSATVWFHELNNDNDLYHPCFLKDLMMYNCPKAQQEIVQYTDFIKILNVSPNGKALIVSAGWNSETPNSIKQNNTGLSGTLFYTIVFGSNVEPKVEYYGFSESEVEDYESDREDNSILR